MRRFLSAAAIAVAMCHSPAAPALNTWGTDMSDLWWNPAESGWGANLAHQQDIIFMTLFVYGQDNRVKWYVADALRSQGGANAYVFTGSLYETTGPFLGGAFNPAAVGIRTVGTATLTLALDAGALTYSVDGVSVSKTIQRQTFRANNLAGSYIGATSVTSTCAGQPTRLENAATFVINHVNASISIAASLNNGRTCTYSGTYDQKGRMGKIDGTASCSNGTQGSFRAFEVEAGYAGFFAQYIADFGGGCREVGRISAIMR
jgi:hypothetical protein